MEIDQLLAPVSAEVPWGEDLEYDPGFREMEQAAQGKPEQQFGDTFIPAEGPDWPKVERLARELFARTKDLRVGLLLTRALTRNGGLPGFSAGLSLLHGLLEKYWDKLHPQLDPDDDNDPTMRLNLLGSLADGDTMLRDLREVEIVHSRAVGRFSFRDIQVATGRITPAEDAEEDLPTSAGIEAAFMDCDEEELVGNHEGLSRARETIGFIQSCLEERVGPDRVVDFGPLGTLLQELGKILQERMGARGIGTAAAGGEPQITAGGPEAGPDASPAATPAAATLPGEVNSRQEVIRLLDKACAYFERNEPSSPVPLLLKRAKRLAGKDFLEVIRDMAPDGVSQVEMIGGVEQEE